MGSSRAKEENPQSYGLGSRGDGVKLIQAALKEKGFIASGPDGVFTEETQEAVKAYQRANGLSEDGALGIETWKRLFHGEKDTPYTFEEVLESELLEINLSRCLRLKGGGVEPASEDDLITRCHDSQFMGLAFSGGGIRSATFNLGVLEALAELKLLRRIDYLSTVSGGGYIGSWLAAWIGRDRSIKAVEEALAPPPADCSSKSVDLSTGAEPPAIKFLRSFSNYITPKTGVFSADTWSVASTYTRNLVLNLTILVTAFICFMLAPRLLVWAFSSYVWGKDSHVLLSPIVILIVTALLLLVCVAFIAWNLKGLTGDGRPRYSVQAGQKWVQWTIVVPAVLTSILIANLLGHYPVTISESDSLRWVLWGSVVYSGLWLVGWAIGQLLSPIMKADPDAKEETEPPLEDRTRNADLGSGSRACRSAWFIISSLLAGAGAGIFFRCVETLFAHWKSGLYFPLFLACILTWGPPLVLLLFSLIVTLHIGLVGRHYSEQLQEWWSRLGGWVLIFVLIWVLWFGLAIYGPWIQDWVLSNDWSKYGFTSTWLAATIAGVLAGKSPSTGTPGSKARGEIIARIAPYAFVMGLLLVMSWLTNVALDFVVSQHYLCKARVDWAYNNLSTLERYLYYMIWTEDEMGVNPTLRLLLPCALLSLLFAWRVDINQFSMHLLYRKRLTRCYLGASNAKRNPQPFTGFDDGDDVSLNVLTPTRWAPDGTCYSGPYLISNTALNLVSGEELAYQERKAASFILTPRFCGYELPATGQARRSGGYRATDLYAANSGGISLGTAMAISGAAVSPNMGYHSSPPLAFLMTVFNIRLGWWLGNPCDRRNAQASASSMWRARAEEWGGLWNCLFAQALAPAWKRAGPRFGLFCLLAELFGLSGDKSRHIYLSDGGHFDNLGLYELVRRRCRYIISCDAGQDPELNCDDLGSAIRKCYADFGIEIEIDVSPIRNRQEGSRSQWHCAVGTIHYGRVDKGAAPGTLIYLKSSLTGDEPTDILSYDARDSRFPHQSTADQWFDEPQFESYRKLGRHIARNALAEAVDTVVERRKRSSVGPQNGCVPSASSGIRPPEGEDDVLVPDVEELFHALRQQWCPPSHAVLTSFAPHGNALEKIFEQLREDENLRFLDAQVYPEWENLTQDVDPPGRCRPWLPETLQELRAGFYLCNSMLQLMENVYIDLRLEKEYDHPDSRGWMNLFKHWAWSGMFRATWAVCACTYGIRFQQFCEAHLGLKLGEVKARCLERDKSGKRLSVAELLSEARDDRSLNIFEAELIGDFSRKNCSLEDELMLWVMELVVEDKAKTSGGLTFPFGFALMDAQGRIVYFRIQDHLRKMGLARRGLRQIMLEAGAAGIQVGIALRDLPRTAREVPGEADRRWFRHLYKSVRHELRLGKRP